MLGGFGLTGSTLMKRPPRVIPTPGWLRPVIRWATRCSLNAPAWLPQRIKNAPLKMTSYLLRGYTALVR